MDLVDLLQSSLHDDLPNSTASSLRTLMGKNVDKFVGYATDHIDETVLEINNENHQNSLVLMVFNNLLEFEQDLRLWAWKLIVRALRVLVDFNLSELTLNARWSFIVTLSQMNAEIIMGRIDDVLNITAQEYFVPESVVALLQCERSTTAFRSCNHPHYSLVHTIIPSRVLIVTGLSPHYVQGFVCMKGFVAVNICLTTDLDTSSLKVVALFTVLGHVMQQSIVRAATGTFNTHTPRLLWGIKPFISGLACCANLLSEDAHHALFKFEPEPESGRKWERAVWNGICPRWEIPNCMAEELAEDILRRFQATNELKLSPKQDFTLKKYVGHKTTDVGIMYFREPIVYIM